MTRALALIGLAGSIGLVAVTFAGKADWGAPGTPAYVGYELMNRLAGGAILLMAAAPGALRRVLHERDIRAGQTALTVTAAGFIGMAIGSAAEFIVFTAAPYSGPGSEVRNASWLTFLVSGLVAVVAAVLAGLALVRERRVPRAAAIGVLAAAPLGVAAAYADGTVFIALPLVGIACAIGALIVPEERYSE